MKKSSLKPYIINAFYSWSLDNGNTPLIEFTDHKENLIPKHIISSGIAIISIHPDYIQNMILGKDNMQFEAFFNGQPFSVNMHYDSVTKIFNKEDGHGLEFDNNELLGYANEDEEYLKDFNNIKALKKKGHLSLIKNEK